MSESRVPGRVLWLVPLFFLVHNLEEAATFGVVRRNFPAWLPLQARNAASSVTHAQFLVALLLVTLLAVAATAWAHLRPSSRGALWSVLLVQSVIALNVGAHVAAAAFILKGYGPGLASALIVNLPFSIYLLRRARRERWVSARAQAALVPGALLLHGPGIVGAYAAAQALAPR
jgi:hypothetical protein